MTKSRPFHLSEEGREVILPERSADDDYGCAATNCSTLFELVDAVRRVVLNDEIRGGSIPLEVRMEHDYKWWAA